MLKFSALYSALESTYNLKRSLSLDVRQKSDSNGNNESSVLKRQQTFTFKSKLLKSFLKESMSKIMTNKGIKVDLIKHKNTHEGKNLNLYLNVQAVNDNKRVACVERSDTTSHEDDLMINEFDSSFGMNIWYHGQFDIEYNLHKYNECDITVETSVQSGSLVANVGKNGDVTCAVIYVLESNTYVEKISCVQGKYCLDFSDEFQPRFASLKKLVVYLIKQKFLQRVTFAWLIENGLS